MAPDIGKIKSNISLMADQGATEEEIDIYVASEGTSAAELSTAPSPAAPAARPTNEVLQEMIVNKRPLPEIEEFLKSTGNDPSGMMGAIQADMGFRAKNPNFTGERGAVTLPKMNPAAKAPPQEQAAESEGPSIIQGGMNSILEGFIPNLSNNSRGFDAAVANGWNALTGDEEFAPREAFDTAYEQTERDKEAFSKNHRGIDLAAKTTGFTGAFALPATKFLQGGKYGASALKSGVINGAATGAGYGALTGLLNPTGSGRLENVVSGAAVGTVLGGLAAPVIRGVTGAGQWLSQVAPPLDNLTTGIQATIARLRGEAPEVPRSLRQAQRVISKGMEGTNISTGMGTGNVPMTAQSVTDEITRRADQGMPAMPADLAEPFRRRTERALRGLGPMATSARERLAARQASQGSRISQRVQEEMGAVADPIRTAELITKRASDAAEPAYREAYDAGVVITPEIQKLIDSPAFQSSIGQARTNILNRGGDPENIGVFQDAAGQASLGTAPTLEAMDNVISTVRGDVARDAFGNQIRNRSISAEQSAVGDLDALLRKQNGLYNNAKTNFADEMAIKDALASGSKVGKMSGHELNAYIRNTPEHAREAWMLGAGTATADKAVVAGQKPTADVSMAVRRDLGLSGAGQASSLGDNVKVTALDEMSGNTGMMSRLDDKLESEAQGFKTFNEAYGGSKTAEKLGIGEDIMAGVTRSFRDILFANPIAAAGSLMSGMGNANLLKFSGEVQEQIAKILTETNPATVQEAFQAIEARAAKDDNFKQLLNRAGVQLSRLTSTGLSGQNGDPFVLSEDQ